MAVFLLIGKTSALTMNIGGVVKDWMLIGLSGGWVQAVGEACRERRLVGRRRLAAAVWQETSEPRHESAAALRDATWLPIRLLFYPPSLSTPLPLCNTQTSTG